MVGKGGPGMGGILGRVKWWVKGGIK